MPLPLSDTQYDVNGLPAGLPVAQEPLPTSQPTMAQRVVDQLLGTNGQERYQLWPERVVRDALSAPHDVMNSPTPMTSEDMIKPAMDISALAGTGGLAGAEASLGSGPFLRPALKYGDKIYKAPVKDASNPLFMGAEHSDAIPANLRADFNKKAMSGDDINDYNFGFVNHKGQFLSREAALDYGIKEGLLSPHDAKFGALTSTMMADSKAGTAIGALEKSQSPFYSALSKNVADIGQSKMTGDQWLGTLSNKPGVKPEEMNWTGLKDYLTSKGKETVSKADVQAHLNDNALKIGEVNKGELSDKDIMTQSKIRQEDWDKMSQSQKEVVRSGFPIDKTKYHSYQLPGGTNYSEKLLTLPMQPNKSTYQIMDQRGRIARTTDDKLEADSLAGMMPGSTVRKVATFDTNAYKSSHWDEPNILAHVRTNDRDVGGVPAKHIEEIQSDWHQQGRDKGYKNNLSDAESSELKSLRDKIEAGTLNGDEAARVGELENKKAAYGGVPNAPFKKSWPELAMKRTIRQAVEEGKSRVSWTPGEAQAARYDLSKQIDSLKWNPKTGQLIGNKDGMPALSKMGVKEEELPNFVGKEAAKKLIDTQEKLDKPTSNSYKELSGVDLKIGGEGMKGFYDQMLPAMVEKIGKKYGVKVKQEKIIAPMKKMGDSGEQPVHYFDIPEKMKQDVLTKGFPLFSKGVPVIPTQRDK